MFIQVFRAALAALVILTTALARAAAPAPRTPAPAFQRLQLGAFEITALSDGMLPLDAKALLRNVTPARLDAALGAAFVQNPVPTSDNAYLVNTGTKLVLIDAGGGTFVVPTMGHVIANLEAAGYRPEDVDEIYLTHLHADHVGGIVSPDGSAAFPHAIVRLDRREAAYWLSDANRAKAAPGDRLFFDTARKSLAPYRAAGKLRTFVGPAALVPGITALATPGHTPGHTSYLVESRGRRLIVWGDIVHVASVQFADPEITIGFDRDPARAIVTRRHLFAMAAKQRTWVADEHISFPGLGHVLRTGDGFQWVPANYEPVMR